MQGVGRNKISVVPSGLQYAGEVKKKFDKCKCQVVRSSITIITASLTHWGWVTHICVIGSEACRLVGAKPVSELILEYC